MNITIKYFTIVLGLLNSGVLFTSESESQKVQIDQQKEQLHWLHSEIKTQIKKRENILAVQQNEIIKAARNVCKINVEMAQRVCGDKKINKKTVSLFRRKYARKFDDSLVELYKQKELEQRSRVILEQLYTHKSLVENKLALLAN